MTEPTMDNKVIFQQDTPDGMEEVIRFDKEGFHYRGQFIADAGEAHRLMVEFLKSNSALSPDSSSRFLIERLLAALENEALAHWSCDPAEDPLIADARAYLAQSQ